MSLEAGALTILVFQMHCLATDVEASGIIVRSASAGGRFHASKTFPRVQEFDLLDLRPAVESFARRLAAILTNVPDTQSARQ
jgi:hypothetical protein